MPNFAYIVKDAKGARVEGVIKADTLDMAVDKLSKEGSTIISVKAAAEGAFRGKLSLFDKVMLTIYKIRTGVTLRVLVFFTRQLSTMFSAGLTIEKAITDLEKEEKNKKFAKVLRKIGDDIRKGYSLSEAMEQHPGVFNPLYVALVQAGEASGTLHTVLDELSDYLEKIEDTKRKVTSAMAYPVFILIFLIGVIWGMFYYIIPMFAEVYADFNAGLPGPTVIAINISDFIVNNLFLAILIFIMAIVALFLVYLTDRGRFIMDTLKLRIPVIGGVITNSIMSKFSRTFSILMAAGVPIMDTMELTENVVQNAVVEGAVRKARVLVKEGYGVANAFRRTGHFPPTLLQMLATGEETGDMDKLLGKAAQFYEKLVDSVIDRLTSLIEPLLIVMMALVVGTIIIVIYLPIFDLGEAISQGFN
ncbi:MAG: type II secretion system F family protein [Candidatus Cloacimonadaceae bacterium]|jgi:type II secretory pathway component PulF|nr:type II secretion system F family protein [Candidatus Cloacimonadota bacterium]MDY0381371.1 type II secretion system F family protein [Candidatus Cloacimonadaceae bacterium]MCB5277012.1 type II secretion system F family protein [Candidatus Cloacimonadota bacterium]MCK9434197.1 type II secretion system F family protein [Candidatus Cloacimonadota bacterium]MDD2616598.1 type II secretion system F family protein [Candidatus Cloacimonadota bacterium]